jgi:hypothetical protein
MIDPTPQIFETAKLTTDQFALAESVYSQPSIRNVPFRAEPASGENAVEKRLLRNARDKMGASL